MKLGILGLLAFVCCAASAQNTDDKPLIWYDEGHPKQLWVDPEWVVEFDAPAAAFGKQANTGAAEPRVLRKSQAQSSRAANGKHYSPVLRDSPGGPMRALPGNVLVQLDPAWSSAQVSSWLSAHNLVEIKKLPIGKNVLLLEAEPGLGSLELANQLQASEGVRWAQPDWWQPISTR